jgi:hypothetical protein
MKVKSRALKEAAMNKIWWLVFILMAVSCVNQTINHEVDLLQDYSFDEVWAASISAINDIGYTIDSVDKETGFISAESGPHVFQHAPPRMSIMITSSNGKVYVDCKLLQKEQFFDLFGIGRKTVRKFMNALYSNLRV